MGFFLIYSMVETCKFWSLSKELELADRIGSKYQHISIQQHISSSIFNKTGFFRVFRTTGKFSINRTGSMLI